MLVTVIESEKGVRVAKLAGKIDSAGVQDFEQATIQVLKGRGVKVVFDFSEVDMIGSQAIGVLVSASNIAKSLGGKIAVCHCNLMVEQSLSVSSIDRIIPVCGDLEAATDLLVSESEPVG